MVTQARTMQEDEAKQAQRRQLSRANIRLAWILSGIVLLSLFATFYFWPTPQLPS